MKEYRKTHPYSREKANLRRKETRKEKKLRIIKIKGGKCEKCGYAKNLAVLELHHPNGYNEEQSSNYLNWSWRRIEMEVLPFTSLLCSNCHHEWHHPELAIVQEQNLGL